MNRSPRSAAFTLIEMITVIAIIVILTGLILSINGLVQRKAASARATAEIKTLSASCEAYKNDNGGYPQDPNYTDTLIPQTSTSPVTGSYAQSSLYLYETLTGDKNATGQPPTTALVGSETVSVTNYAPDFFKPSRLGVNTSSSPGAANYVQFIMDPYGNPYGYSTAGLANEQQFRQALSNPNTAAGAARKLNSGYNSTFDLWSTGGATSSNTATWIKNW
jgi:prepilin-type N-terminal cleavage/methylation domain-containing protein